jgi:hypothetical protein
MSTFRDFASGLYSTYDASLQLNPIEDILKSYNRIQKLKLSPLFNEQIKQMTHAGIQYIGCLDELIDVILSHVTEVLETG